MYNDKETTELMRFNLMQLRVVLEEIKQFEVQSNYIRVSAFLDIYLKKYVRLSCYLVLYETYF
jgi:hypothetical protein